MNIRYPIYEGVYRILTFLKIQTYEADIPYRSKYHLAEQGCPFGRLFLFPMPYGNENDEDTHGKDREAHTAIDRP